MTNQRTARWSAKIEAIYENQGREMWAMLYSQCCDPEAAYDALQEAFTRLHEQNGTPILDVRAWVLRVGGNWLRDAARRRTTAAREFEHLDSLPGKPNDPPALLQRQELFAGVRQALASLRDDDREVLVLRYALGWSSHRIATALNATSAAVDMRLLRARRRLAEVFKESGIDNEQL
jgi:RNA polymerase sigma-70 factor (ECF subfamily)